MPPLGTSGGWFENAAPPILTGVPWVSWTGGLRVLGTPLGRSSYVRSQASAIAEELGHALDVLQCLGCPQSASLILRSCLGAAKTVHLLRSMTYFEANLLAHRVELNLKSAWGAVVGAPLSEALWSLACFPVRLGGLGVVNPVRIHPQAAVSALGCSRLQ